MGRGISSGSPVHTQILLCRPQSPDLLSSTHSTELGFPRGLSALAGPGIAASRFTAQGFVSVILGQKLPSSLAPELVHTLVERILLVEVEVGVDV